MLALAEYREMYCSGCGGELEKTMHIDNEFAYTATPWVCWGCKAIDKGVSRYQESHPNARPPGRWSLEKR